MPRKLRSSQSYSDHFSEDAQASERPRKRAKQMEPSSPLLDSQEFVAGVQKVIAKAKNKKDDVYIAKFKKKVDERQKALAAAIDSKLNERLETLEKRQTAAAMLLALVPQPDPDSSTPSNAGVPTYLAESRDIASETSGLCRGTVESYHQVVQVISEQASILSTYENWKKELSDKQQMLKAGLKDAQDGIDRVLGSDDDAAYGQRCVGQNSMEDLTKIEEQHVEQWRNLDVAKDPTGMHDDETTLVEPDMNVDETFQQTTLRIEKYTRRMMKNVDERD